MNIKMYFNQDAIDLFEEYELTDDVEEALEVAWSDGFDEGYAEGHGEGYEDGILEADQ